MVCMGLDIIIVSGINCTDSVFIFQEKPQHIAPCFIQQMHGSPHHVHDRLLQTLSETVTQKFTYNSWSGSFSQIDNKRPRWGDIVARLMHTLAPSWGFVSYYDSISVGLGAVKLSEFP